MQKSSPFPGRMARPGPSKGVRNWVARPESSNGVVGRVACPESSKGVVNRVARPESSKGVVDRVACPEPSEGVVDPVAYPKSRCGSAFTLLEVILALAILAGALASLGEVVRLSGENARMARDLSQAQLLAASKLAEITAGIENLSTVERAALDIEGADPPWLYSIQWEPTLEEDLIIVSVTVEQDLPEDQHPVQFSLVRWMPDPGAVLAEDTSAGGESESSTASEGG